MNINFPAFGQSVAAANDRVVDRNVTTSVATATCVVPSVDAPISSVGSDAELLRSAEAALKVDPASDNRVSEIKAAIQAGAIRFDADSLAAGILRYHARQD